MAQAGGFFHILNTLRYLSIPFGSTLLGLTALAGSRWRSISHSDADCVHSGARHKQGCSNDRFGRLWFCGAGRKGKGKSRNGLLGICQIATAFGRISLFKARYK